MRLWVLLSLLLLQGTLPHGEPPPSRRVPPLYQPPRGLLTAGTPRPPSARPPRTRHAGGGCPWPVPLPISPLPPPPAMTAPGAGPAAISGGRRRGSRLAGQRREGRVGLRPARRTGFPPEDPNCGFMPSRGLGERRLRQHHSPPPRPGRCFSSGVDASTPLPEEGQCWTWRSGFERTTTKKKVFGTVVRLWRGPPNFIHNRVSGCGEVSVGEEASF